MKNESNEIDLLELLAKVYFLFKRNKYIILAFAILGVIVSIYKSSKSEPYYQTEMTAKTPLESEVVKNQLEVLTNHQKNQNINLLAQELDIKKEDAKQIKSITVEEVEETSLMRISLKVLDTNLIHRIQEGIINFSETNKFLREQLKSKHRHYEQYLNKISEALELLRKQENKKITPQSQEKISIEEGNYARQIIQLMDKKEQVEENLIENKPLIIVNGFHIPEKAQTDTTTQFILYTVIGLFLGIVFVVVKFLIVKIEHYKKN